MTIISFEGGGVSQLFLCFFEALLFLVGFFLNGGLRQFVLVDLVFVVGHGCVLLVSIACVE